MIITTTQPIEGQSIREYKGIVVAAAIMCSNVARALENRVVGRSGVLGQNTTELRALSSSKLYQLAYYARDELRIHLRAFKG